MLKNYFLAALRNLKKHLSYSVINIAGLGLGLATCLLLVTWIRQELSFDTFHANAKRIYRGSMEYSFGGQVAKTSVSPTALLPTMQKNFAEIEAGVRVYNPAKFNPFIVRKDDKLFQEGRFYFADSTFFKVFSFKLLQGNPDNALTEPNSVILTQSTARKYFGDENALGQLLQINNRSEYKVTGIMEDLPSNSMLQFQFLGSFSSLPAAKDPIWWSANYQTFIVLAPGTDIHTLRDKTNVIVKEALASELTNAGDYVVYNFTPLTDIYLRSDVDEPEVTGSIQYIYIFSAIAFLVLVIACINYINLATAKAADRAKEVGIRKVVGALRKQLIFQFICESFIITVLGFIFAFLLAQLTLPLFNILTGKHFNYLSLLEPQFLVACLIALVIISAGAGAYPALAITSFRPVSVLKGNFKTSGRGVWLRQLLVVFQFGVSIILIVGTIVILKQLNFIQEKKLGYDKDRVIILPLDRKVEGSFEQLKTEFLRSGKVVSMGRATESPTKINGGYGIKTEGGTSDVGMIITAMSVDQDFVPTLGMKFVAGQNFTEADFKQWEADTTSAFILNESAIKELGLTKENAVGTKINLSSRKGQIAGVVEDFHFSSLHQSIGPVALFIENSNLSYIFVKLAPGDIRASLADLKAICANIAPHRPFEYQFLDQEYQSMYDKEQRMGVISTVFASLAIIIACLGLLGLVAFAAAQKTKEIGIRKVLGATSSNIVMLITQDYTKLLAISIVLGLPLAYWVMNNLWLHEFAYRTTVGATPLLAASLLCVGIAFITASYQAVKAAWIDPAKTLRSE